MLIVDETGFSESQSLEKTQNKGNWTGDSPEFWVSQLRSGLPYHLGNVASAFACTAAIRPGSAPLT
ncbi:hypothetical protein NLM24_02735 [Nocardia zapadnayensis]|uniref:hypothetical protein n=1 Tax=Nocardia rhamnosiphila TaxID=426716 RepID=UPI002247B6DA|nr:hypothetical protein [Nocardia zapadnayensis]MCX0269644.1 hypothetical protein [Nocardia zapadnayensis]